MTILKDCGNDEQEKKVYTQILSKRRCIEKRGTPYAGTIIERISIEFYSESCRVSRRHLEVRFLRWGHMSLFLTLLTSFFRV